jgi:hypothetical protein
MLLIEEPGVLRLRDVGERPPGRPGTAPGSTGRPLRARGGDPAHGRLGFTNVEIAAQMFLSIRTVETHRSHIQQKLRLRARSDLVQYALDHGLMEPGTLPAD